MSFYTPFLYGLTPVPALEPSAPEFDITFYPRTLGPGYGYFASAYLNRSAGEFLFDNDVAGYGRTEADDLALIEKAREAGFSTRVVCNL